MSAAATFNLMAWFSIRDRAAAQKGPEPSPANGETSTSAPSSTPAPQPTYVSLPRAVQSPAGMPAATPAARPRTTTAGSGSVPMQSPAGFVAPHPAATHPAAAASISSSVGGPTITLFVRIESGTDRNQAIFEPQRKKMFSRSDSLWTEQPRVNDTCVINDVMH
jgi:hypothetical protein